MRRQTAGAPFGVVFVFYLLAFLFFLVRSIFTFPAQELLALFMWPYVWSTAFLELVRYAVALTLAGAAVSYSLLSSPRGSRIPFHRIISSHLAGMIALAVLYTALYIGVQPRVQTNLQQLYSLSNQARTYLAQAESALETGDRHSAVQSYERYLAIDEHNPAIQSQVTDLRSQLYGEAEEQTQEQTRDSGFLADDLAEGLSPPELMDRAQRFLEQGDYFTAYYYADLAFQTDGGPGRAEARRLAARAREMIRTFDLTPLEARQAGTFAEKRRGFELYNKGEYVQSYRIFYALKQEEPRDLEVDKYLELSRSALAAQAFFLDEARQAEAMPGAERLLFLNPRQEDAREIVYLGKMTGTPEGVFFADIEVAGFTSAELLYHYGAHYGKLYEGQINLHGIDRRQPQIETGLEPYAGKMSGGAGDVPEMLELVPPPGVLSTLKSERRSLEASSLFTIWRVRNHVASYGHLQAPVGVEILMRILLPFSFLILALVGMSVGWRFRADPSRRPGWPAYVLMPVFPLLALYLASFYVSAQRVILAFVMVRFSFLAALIVLVALQGLALFLALTALAGQRGD